MICQYGLILCQVTIPILMKSIQKVKELLIKYENNSVPINIQPSLYYRTIVIKNIWLCILIWYFKKTFVGILVLLLTWWINLKSRKVFIHRQGNVQYDYNIFVVYVRIVFYSNSGTMILESMVFYCTVV